MVGMQEGAVAQQHAADIIVRVRTGVTDGAVRRQAHPGKLEQTQLRLADTGVCQSPARIPSVTWAFCSSHRPCTQRRCCLSREEEDCFTVLLSKKKLEIDYEHHL